MRSHIFIAAAAASAAAAAGGGRRRGGGDTVLGCNVIDNAFRGFVFADLAKQALKFGTPSAPSDENATVDEAGWPTQDFSISVYSEGVGKAALSFPPAQIDGVYCVSARGNASVSLPASQRGSVILNQSYDAATNLLVAFLSVPADPDAVGGRIELVFTGSARDPADPSRGAGLTNVSVLQPGYALGTDPNTFSAGVLATHEFCRGGVVRVMPWWLAQSNTATGSPATSAYWSKRSLVGAPSYLLGVYGTHGPGVPWEVMVDFVNALEADIWVNVPAGQLSELNATARDEYIREVLTLVDQRLAPGRRIFTEYGNELWNGAFAGYDVNVAFANQSVLLDGDPFQLNFGLALPPDPANLLSFWAPRHIAYVSKHAADIAASIVGAARVGRADVPGVRVCPVVGAQGGFPGQGELLLSYLHDVWGSPAAISTLAIDGYVSLGADANYSADEVFARFDSLFANLSAVAPGAWCSNPKAAYSAIAAYYGYELHAYEAAPINGGSLQMQGYSDALQDPRMESVAMRTVALWQSWGGGTFNWFTGGAETTFCPWGSTGATWDNRVLDTPKLRAAREVTSSAPAPVTAGLVLPFRNRTFSMAMQYYSPTCAALPFTPVEYLEAGAAFSYLARRTDPTAPCALNITVYMCNTNSSGGLGALQVSVGAFMVPIIVRAPPYAGGCKHFTPVSAAFPPLPPGRGNADGLVTVRFTVPTEPPQTTKGNAGFALLALDAECR
jgi:hypothetical protein